MISNQFTDDFLDIIPVIPTKFAVYALELGYDGLIF